MADIKNFLYAWCGKKKLTPNYDIRAAGNKNRQKFTCEVRVDGYNYIGMGNSTNKKDAQTNSARDFVNYLVRVGEINAAEVPAIGVGPPEADQPDRAADGSFGTLPSSGPLPPHLVVKEEQVEGGVAGPVPGVTGQGYSGGGGAQWDRGANLKEYYARRDEQEAQATLESEEVDLNANLHGNWTLENAKARLNQYFQKEKTSAEYKYSQVGPDHNRSGPENPVGLRTAEQIQTEASNTETQICFNTFGSNGPDQIYQFNVQLIGFDNLRGKHQNRSKGTCFCLGLDLVLTSL